MSDEERRNLLSEIEEVRMRIESLEPELHNQEKLFGRGFQDDRARLAALRKELARDMEQLHASEDELNRKR